MFESIYKTIKKFFTSYTDYDPLIEGIYADQYVSQDLKDKIKQRYAESHPEPVETPETHPWKYDPLSPPQGWKYDPYYELWIRVPTSTVIESQGLF